MKKIKILDTFAGIWGFSLALEQSIGKENIEHIGFSEIDKFAKIVYKEHFENVPDLGDITKIDIENLADFDLLTGWFPCQDISVAGKQDLTRGRSALVEYLLKILEVKQPKYFIFENVKNLLGKKFETFFTSIIQRVENAGYEVKFKVLNTKDFWLPQNRQRVFIVWGLNSLENFDFPKEKELKIFLKDILEQEVDSKYNLSEKQLERIRNSKEITKDNILFPREKNGKNIKLKDFTSFSQDNTFCWGGDIVPTLTASDGGNRPKVYWVVRVNNGTEAGYIDGVAGDGVVLDNPTSTTKRGRIKSQISGTLTVAGQDGVITSNLDLRRLTPKECLKLQGFPKDWCNSVSDSQGYKQAGNAISVPVVKAIFDNLFKNESKDI